MQGFGAVSLLRRGVTSNLNQLKNFKPKIQASKPKNTFKPMADAIVVLAAGGAIAEIVLRLRYKNSQVE
eukprot:CAMPEP_0184327802 /NCGR_PEP_ID=MMETSP1049-20130417/143284_1 /TAXON_ID=77928 /ORGANISM="Proteomonas sulcata, Strain CCMP704" /LENGTH=68 /DNA_ID=CAMNT_0026650077 /DNA_START=408 /DNA_END=614 /DNA_ORIENTATION=-